MAQQFLFGSAIVFAVVAPPKGTEDLQGEWKAALIEMAGKKTDDAAVNTVGVVNKDDKFTLKSGDKVVEEVTLTVDATRNPKQITITPIKGPRKGQAHLGIYSVDKGTLKICWAMPKKERPTEFASTAESGNFLIVLKLNKP
jgi:uncharacterized protein (TIGR03067 family)